MLRFYSWYALLTYSRIFGTYFFLSILYKHLNITYDTDVPLVLMNSFNTDEDTKKILQKYSHCRAKIYTFNQSRYFVRLRLYHV